MATKLAPATHLVQGVKAGNNWRFLVIDVARRTVGAAEGPNIARCIVDALTRAQHPESAYKKAPETWAIQTSNEFIFMEMKSPEEAKEAWDKAFRSTFKE